MLNTSPVTGRAAVFKEAYSIIDGALAHLPTAQSTLQQGIGLALSLPVIMGSPGNIAAQAQTYQSVSKLCGENVAAVQSAAQDRLPAAWTGVSGASAAQLVNALAGQLENCRLKAMSPADRAEFDQMVTSMKTPALAAQLWQTLGQNDTLSGMQGWIAEGEPTGS
jgi:hypothetical protein